jgi:hypothetical protein
VNHFLPERLYVYLGRDIVNPNFFSGQLALVNIVLGTKAQKKDDNFVDDSDSLSFTKGISTLRNPDGTKPDGTKPDGTKDQTGAGSGKTDSGAVDSGKTIKPAD